MPPWGRPLGRRERERLERYIYDENRVEELSSDEDRHGVALGAVSKNRRSVSDELFFNDGASRHPRNYSDEHLAYGDRYDSPENGESEEDQDRGLSLQVPRSESQEQLLAQRALERIDRAKAKGKPAVNLTHEEIEALERRYARDSSRDSPERERKRSSPKDNRSPSASNGAWTRKKGSRRSSLLASAAAPSKQRSAKPGKLKDSPPQEPYTTSSSMIPGPGGAPMYSPLGYYNTQPPTTRRTTSSEKRPSPPRSQGISRSTSDNPRPPYDTATTAPYPYTTRQHHHHDTRASSMPAEQDYFPYPGQYQAYSGSSAAPSQSTRRISSGPAEVSYSSVYRRVPPGSSNLSSSAVRASRLPTSSSDPALQYLTTERGRGASSGLGVEYDAGAGGASSPGEQSEDELAPSPREYERRDDMRDDRTGGGRPRRRR